MAREAAAGRFDLGDVVLASGAVMPGAFLTWRRYGTLAPDGILDPERWFVVVPDMFGTGSSSSPCNTPTIPRW